jgi:hypothetical protein
MMPERAITPEHSQEEVIKHFLRSQIRTIDPRDKQICGLVSTTAQMLTHAVKTERIVDKSHAELFGTNTLIVTVTPNFLSRVGDDGEVDFTDLHGTRMGLEARAGIDASNHYFLSQLGLSFDDEGISYLANEYLRYFEYAQDPESKVPVVNDLRRGRIIEAYDEFLPHVPEHLVGKVTGIAQEALEQRGFVLGLSTNAQFTVEGPVLQGLPEFYITSSDPRGFSYTDFVLNEPLGDHEVRLLQDWREGKRDNL